MYASDGEGPKGFKDWVLRYESMSEPLVRLAGVIGRWGSHHEHQLMIEVIQTLLSKAYARRVGSEDWVELKRYRPLWSSTGMVWGLLGQGA